jgi:hypothetical protein
VDWWTEFILGLLVAPVYFTAFKVAAIHAEIKARR